LSGKKGPKTDAVLFNSAAALYVARKAESIENGIAMAREVIESGKALKQLKRFIELSNA